jgi:hypothetical protein
MNDWPARGGHRLNQPIEHLPPGPARGLPVQTRDRLDIRCPIDLARLAGGDWWRSSESL